MMQKRPLFTYAIRSALYLPQFRSKLYRAQFMCAIVARAAKLVRLSDGHFLKCHRGPSTRSLVDRIHRRFMRWRSMYVKTKAPTALTGV